jgi:mannose-1-phosphate guanylyltransferase
VPALPRANIIAEPCGRNTAPCIGLMCALLAARDENSVLAVVPADHHIPNKDVYAQTIRDAAVVAAREKALVTIGIAPTFPETGFGYVLAGAPLDTATPTQFSRVDRFVEKPSRARAEELLATSRALWNAGMFVFRVVDMLAAFAAHMPDLHTGLERIRTAAAAGAADIDRIIAEVYAAAPSISIDYGVMEKAANVIVAHGRFIWDDVGSWRAVAAHWPRDAAGNANCGTVVTVDTAGSVLRNEGHGVVAVIGMRDIIVVRTDDAVLVCPLDRAQDVKQIVQTLQADASLRALTE